MVPAGRLLVVSHIFAPHASGSAVLMANLLREYKGPCLAVRGYSKYVKEDPHFDPPCPTLAFEPWNVKFLQVLYPRFVNSNRWLLRWYLHRRIRQHRPDAILGVFPHSTFFIAAYEVAKHHKIPFYAHMHDCWQENYPPGYYARNLADRYEAEILQGADRVFCMTETQAEHYANKYNIRPFILPHTVPPLEVEGLSYQPVTAQEPKILFAGALSDVFNADALAVFSRALALTKNKVSCTFYTNAKPEDLRQRGVDLSNISLEWVSRAELILKQRTCSILLAPLSHKNCSPLEVKTVFSTKLLDYFISGRPILLFAPADSFHARSAAANGWGLVVSEDKPQAIADAIDKLLMDEALCRRLVEGAFKEARERVATRYASELLQNLKKDTAQSHARASA